MGPVSLRDNMPHRCGKMMYTDSGYSRLAWDRLMEALIDPENGEACGRIVIEPGTDVKQSRKNVVMMKVHGLKVRITLDEQKYRNLIKRYWQEENFWCIRLLKANQTTHTEGATGFIVQLQKCIHMVVCRKNVVHQTF